MSRNRFEPGRAPAPSAGLARGRGGDAWRRRGSRPARVALDAQRDRPRARRGGGELRAVVVERQRRDLGAVAPDEVLPGPVSPRRSPWNRPSWPTSRPSIRRTPRRAARPPAPRTAAVMRPPLKRPEGWDRRGPPGRRRPGCGRTRRGGPPSPPWCAAARRDRSASSAAAVVTSLRVEAGLRFFSAFARVQDAARCAGCAPRCPSTRRRSGRPTMRSIARFSVAATARRARAPEGSRAPPARPGRPRPRSRGLAARRDHRARASLGQRRRRRGRGPRSPSGSGSVSRPRRAAAAAARAGSSALHARERDRHHRHARLEREHEAAALEREHVVVAAARALREDDHAVPADPRGRAQAAPRAEGVGAVDADVPGQVQVPADQGQRVERALVDDPEVGGQAAEQDGDVERARVVGRVDDRPGGMRCCAATAPGRPTSAAARGPRNAPATGQAVRAEQHRPATPRRRSARVTPRDGKRERPRPGGRRRSVGEPDPERLGRGEGPGGVPVGGRAASARRRVTEGGVGDGRGPWLPAGARGRRSRRWAASRSVRAGRSRAARCR